MAADPQRARAAGLGGSPSGDPQEARGLAALPGAQQTPVNLGGMAACRLRSSAAFSTRASVSARRRRRSSSAASMRSNSSLVSGSRGIAPMGPRINWTRPDKTQGIFKLRPTRRVRERPRGSVTFGCRRAVHDRCGSWGLKERFPVVTPEEMRKQATRWRLLAQRFANDDRAAKALTEAAQSLVEQAERLERRTKTPPP